MLLELGLVLLIVPLAEPEADAVPPKVDWLPVDVPVVLVAGEELAVEP